MASNEYDHDYAHYAKIQTKKLEYNWTVYVFSIYIRMADINHVL